MNYYDENLNKLSQDNKFLVKRHDTRFNSSSIIIR